MKKTIGQTIADQRKAQGMTQKDLADKMNVTDKAVSKWERDLSIPDIASIPKLAGILQISVEELLTSTEEPAAEPQWKNILHITLKTVPLAMGVALVVTSALNQIDTNSAFGMAGIALFCLSLRQMEK